MNSFMSWVGGKKALREEIVQRFPLSYERYIEVFGGGGWVLFHKPPGRDFEVYNDFNSLLANLYRCVRDRHEELIDSLRYVLNSREDFELIKQALARDNVNLPEGQREDALGRSPASDVQKASWPCAASAPPTSSGRRGSIRSSATATPRPSPATAASPTICGPTSPLLSRPTGV